MKSNCKVPEFYLVYDGECPFCSFYVKYVRIKQDIGTLKLINARHKSSITDDVLEKGFDLNKGMVLKIEDQYFHGDDCMNKLALLSTRNSIFNKMNFWIFKSKLRSKILYPVLRSGRNITLYLLGKKEI